MLVFPSRQRERCTSAEHLQRVDIAETIMRRKALSSQELLLFIINLVKQQRDPESQIQLPGVALLSSVVVDAA